MPTGCELISLEDGATAGFDGSLVVGRHPGCDLVLPFGVVSSRHAAIEWIQGRWRVRDLGSRNGTTVNRRRIRGWRALSEGDVVRFAGRSAWRVQRLVPPPAQLAPTFHPTEGPRGKPIGPLLLELTYDGPGGGVIGVRIGEESFEAHAGNPFILLDLLAREPGAWIDDGEIKSALWGRRADRLTRSALHTLIHNTRRLFEGWGVDGSIIEKERGRTRLGLYAGQVRRRPPAD